MESAPPPPGPLPGRRSGCLVLNIVVVLALMAMVAIGAVLYVSDEPVPFDEVTAYDSCRKAVEREGGSAPADRSRAEELYDQEDLASYVWRVDDRYVCTVTEGRSGRPFHVTVRRVGR